MIIGTFIRHYKCYRKVNFIQFVTPYHVPYYSLIIGGNGVGKSSILEALDVYFNRSEFVLSRTPTGHEKWQEALVSPIYYFDKEGLVDRIWGNCLGNIKKGQVEKITTVINDFLWSYKAPSAAVSQAEFTKLRDKLPFQKKDGKTLLIDGIDFESNLRLGTFESLESNLDAEFDKRVLIQYFNALRSVVSYIYIPVETSISDYLRLEAQGIQSLMGLDIKNKIDSIFNDEIKKNGETTTVQKFINHTLEEFVSETEEVIQSIERDYSFKPDTGVKKNVTAKDFRAKVIEQFFKNRELKRGETKIKDLSSGQRKKALIDIIYALLLSKDTENDDPHLILAIDEPEASLHVNNCFDQFEKLETIADKNIQTLVTTHWYGSLPVISNGTVIHVKENEGEPPELSAFNSSNLYDNHDAHRIQDIEFKSIYDLASAILSSLRHGKKSWIIVEGHSDKKYLESYFDSKEIKILSIGGIDRMISLADFLSVPLKNVKETSSIKNKVVFLSDNDQEYKLTVSDESRILKFKRYVFKEGEVDLVDYSEQKHGEVLSIEDVLDSSVMWSSLNELSKVDKDLDDVLKEFVLETEFSISKLKGEYSFLKTQKTGREKVELIKKYEAAIRPLKTRLALKYNELSGDETIDWIEELKKIVL